jgi:hypothetical protein
MAILLKCKTDFAVLLVGAQTGEGPMRFFVGDPKHPGIVFRVQPATGLNEQFIGELGHLVGQPIDGRYLDVEQAFQNPVVLANGEAATLFLAKWQPNTATVDFSSWVTMPYLLRQMPKDRNRLGYLKAWQVLTGALSESTKAVDLLDILDVKLH